MLDLGMAMVETGEGEANSHPDEAGNGPM